MPAIGGSDGRAMSRRKAPDASAEGQAKSSPEIRQLRALVALVESGSMTAAARRLAVSQSTVSEAVAALERTLGAAIVVRRGGARGVGLTAAGEAFLPHARGILASLAAAEAAVAAASREARSRVRVIANESISTYLLPPALAELRRHWPNSRFIVSVGTCPMVREGIASGEHEVGLMLELDSRARRGDDPHASSAATPLGAAALVVFADPAHPLARSGAIERRELAPFPVFSSDAAGEFHSLLDRYFHADGLPGPRLEAAGSVEAVKRSVADQPRALGVLPAYALARELADRSVAALSLRPGLPRLQVGALLSASAGTIPAAAELVAALGATLASTGAPVERTPRGRRA